MKAIKRLISIVLCTAMTLLLAAPALAASTETRSISVFSVEGNNASVNRGGKTTVKAKSGMKLGEGYNVCTGNDTTLYFQVDDDKAIKMDSSSSVTISRASDKKLTITVNSGELFFDVKKPVASGTDVSFRAGGTTMGIRGTAGYIAVKPSNVSSSNTAEKGLIGKLGIGQQMVVTFGLFEGVVNITLDKNPDNPYTLTAGNSAVATIKNDQSEYEIVWQGNIDDTCSFFAMIAALENKDSISFKFPENWNLEELKKLWQSEQNEKKSAAETLINLMSGLQSNTLNIDYDLGESTTNANNNDSSSDDPPVIDDPPVTPVITKTELPSPLTITPTGLLTMSDYVYRTADGGNANKIRFRVDMSGVTKKITFYAQAVSGAAITSDEIMANCQNGADGTFSTVYDPAGGTGYIDVELDVGYESNYTVEMTALEVNNSLKTAADVQNINVTTGKSTSLTMNVYDGDGNLYNGTKWVKSVKVEVADTNWDTAVTPTNPYVIKQGGTTVAYGESSQSYTGGVYTAVLNITDNGEYTIEATGTDSRVLTQDVKIAASLEYAGGETAAENQDRFSFGTGATSKNFNFMAVSANSLDIPGKVYLKAYKQSETGSISAADIIANGASSDYTYTAPNITSTMSLSGLDENTEYVAAFAIEDEAGNITSDANVAKAEFMTGQAALPSFTINNDGGNHIELADTPTNTAAYAYLSSDAELFAAAPQNLTGIPSANDLITYTKDAIDGTDDYIYYQSAAGDTVIPLDDAKYADVIGNHDAAFYIEFVKTSSSGGKYFSDTVVTNSFSGASWNDTDYTVTPADAFGYTIDIDEANTDRTANTYTYNYTPEASVTALNLQFGITYPATATYVCSVNGVATTVDDLSNVFINVNQNADLSIVFTAQNLVGTTTVHILWVTP